LISSDLLSASRDGDNLIATATNAKYQDYSAGLRGANGFTEIIEKTLQPFFSQTQLIVSAL
jgi:hypothetical protein